MSRTNYGRGADFERRIRAWLETLPTTVLCVRSAGSHSPADLVCVEKHGRVSLYQCKKNGRLSAVERSILCDLSRASNSPVFAVKLGLKGEIKFECMPPNEGLSGRTLKGVWLDE